MDTSRSTHQPTSRPLVAIAGLRAIPNTQGGVETHVEQLAPRLAGLGWRVQCMIRSPYATSNRRYEEWNNVRLRTLWCPRTRSLETIVHTFLCVVHAGITRPRILHLHAIGPAIFTPLARALGLKVVFTHHGPDYVREKWGPLGRVVLRMGEALGALFANQAIAISKVIQDHLKTKYGVHAELIPNGVPPPTIVPPGRTLEELGLMRARYVITVGRLVPEKRHKDLISAFRAAKMPGWKLVIVGGADHDSNFARELLESGAPDTVFAGQRSRTELAELYSNAGAFVLPSSHEGLPIALLEAISYGLPFVVSNIPAHVEMGFSEAHFFPLGDQEALVQKLKLFEEGDERQRVDDDLKQAIGTDYSWDEVAVRTNDVYLRTLVNSQPPPAQKAL